MLLHTGERRSSPSMTGMTASARRGHQPGDRLGEDVTTAEDIHVPVGRDQGQLLFVGASPDVKVTPGGASSAVEWVST